jgi:hypothetical protein
MNSRYIMIIPLLNSAMNNELPYVDEGQMFKSAQVWSKRETK